MFSRQIKTKQKYEKIKKDKARQNKTKKMIKQTYDKKNRQ